jgi:hypothetical protein
LNSISYLPFGNGSCRKALLETELPVGPQYFLDFDVED